MKPYNFKIPIFLLVLPLVLFPIFWSCQAVVYTGMEKEDSIGVTVDSIIPDSSVIPIDSLKHGKVVIEVVSKDSSVVEKVVLKAPFEQIYAPNTLFETKISVYELHLDTATIVLIDGQNRHLKYFYDFFCEDFLMLTNGGMFHPKGIPVGLFQNDSIAAYPLNLEDGYGNFFLHPNGVFYITETQKVGVLESQVFLDSIYNKEIPLQIATQSGPMLIVDGSIHPKFNQKSSNKYIRSGVGVTDDQRVVFILSEEVVNLYTFAKMFEEKGCRNALYLDGAISTMYIKGRADNIENYRIRYGPVIGVMAKQNGKMPNDTTLSTEDSCHQKVNFEKHEK